MLLLLSRNLLPAVFDDFCMNLATFYKQNAWTCIDLYLFKAETRMKILWPQSMSLGFYCIKHLSEYIHINNMPLTADGWGSMYSTTCCISYIHIFCFIHILDNSNLTYPHTCYTSDKTLSLCKREKWKPPLRHSSQQG